MRLPSDANNIKAGAMTTDFNDHTIYRLIAKSASCGIVVYDRDLIYRAWNPAMEDISGKTADEVIGKHPLEIYPFLREIGVIDQLENALRGEYARTVPFPCISLETGQSGWATISCSPLREDDGYISGVVGIVQDITDWKLTESALADAHSFLQSVVSTAPTGILAYKASGKCVSANQAAANIVGSTIDQLFAQNFRNLDSWKRGGLLEAAEQALSSGETVMREINVVTTFGKEVFYDAYFTPFVASGDKHLLLILHDISGKKQSADALKTAHDRMEAILGALPDLMFEIDEHGIIHDYNSPKIEDLYVPPEVFLGKNVFEVLPEDAAALIMNQSLETIKTGLSGKTTYSLEIGGELKWFEMSVARKKVSSGAKRCIALARDISDRMRMESEKAALQNQLFQSQKMEAVGHLAGGMAHDFNNMLGVIMSAAELVAMEIEESSPAHEELGQILGAVRSARDLTLKLLTFSRKEKIETRGVESGKILNDIKGILRRTAPKNINLHVEAKDNCLILCDPNQIQQALINVCNNAVDAMPMGGQISIASSEANIVNNICETCGEILDGKYCLIQIDDTGVGMAKETVLRVTEPFFTTKGIGKGTGLGLSVTLGIVHSHNGHLHIYSEPGKGTSVKLYIPISDSATPRPGPEENTKSAMGTETILVVDDEKELLLLAGKILSKNGYRPLLAENGKDALDIYNENKDKIAAALIDLMMPTMDGAELSRKLSSINPDIKIVYSSGFSTDGLAGSLLQDKHRRFVQKPFDMKLLCATLRELIDE